MSDTVWLSSFFCADMPAVDSEISSDWSADREIPPRWSDINIFTVKTRFPLHIARSPRHSSDQLRQFPKILRTEQASTCGHDNKRVEWNKIRPTRWQGHQMALFKVEEHPVLTPVVSVHLEVELTPKQRMEWMAYPKTSSRNVTLRCSRRQTPTPSANPLLRPSSMKRSSATSIAI